MKRVVVKPGVVFTEFNDPLLYLIMALIDVGKINNRELVITSATDGKHLKRSLHYKSLALDIRTRDMEFNEAQLIASDLRKHLGQKYDVVVEKDHIHVEFDQK